jgi:hypothetical protein
MHSVLSVASNTTIHIKRNTQLHHTLSPYIPRPRLQHILQSKSHFDQQQRALKRRESREKRREKREERREKNEKEIAR